MKTVQSMLAEADAAVPRISPEEAKGLLGRADVLFLDVREPSEVAASGKVRGAVAVPRGLVEFRAFENVYILTGGGPADSTMLISIFTYTVSFFSFDLGLGAASSWMTLVVSLLMCAGFIAVIRKKGTQ